MTGAAPRSSLALSISLALTVPLALSLVLDASAQRALPVDGERALIPSGDVVLGTREEDLRAAADVCRRESRFDGGASCTIERFASELALGHAHVPAFAIDRTEVTRGSYRACVVAGACAPAAEDGAAGEDLPVVGIDLRRAQQVCAFREGRLPTEAEWTRAARADTEHHFPWGDVADLGLGNHGRPPLLEDASDGHRGLSPVGSYPGGRSPFGALDMAGNAWEWTSSLPSATDLELVGGAITPSAYRVVRGGSFLHPGYAMRVAARSFLVAVDLTASDLGVRCAYDVR